MDDLLKKKFVPCEGGVIPFDISEIHKYQKKVDGWDVIKNKADNHELEKKFETMSDEIVAASDAFFPFVDGIEKLIQSGVKAIIQPSGSVNDKEIIKFANETNTVLLFSKTRHFRH